MGARKRNFELSVVIPAYNEEKRIAATIRKLNYFLRRKKIKHEIIVVDDGSSDSTLTQVEKVKGKNLKIIKCEVNRGKGYAVKKGVLTAYGSKILFSDSDLSTPIEEYDKLSYWYDKGYKICIGSRRSKGSKILERQPFFRQISGIAFGYIVQFLALGREIKDSQCGFKLFEAKIAKQLFSKQTINGFSFDVEILYLAKKSKIRIKEVPVVWINSPKHSKVNIFKESLKMLRDIIKIKITHG